MKLFLQAAAAVFVTVYQHQLRGSRKNIDFLFLKAVVWRILTGFSGFPVFAQNLPPTARVENVTNEFFGMKVTDPYRWMKNLESKETQDWRRAQAVYADAHLRKLR